jgi:hypothetical protein
LTRDLSARFRHRRLIGIVAAVAVGGAVMTLFASPTHSSRRKIPVLGHGKPLASQCIGVPASPESKRSSTSRI